MSGSISVFAYTEQVLQFSSGLSLQQAARNSFSGLRYQSFKNDKMTTADSGSNMPSSKFMRLLGPAAAVNGCGPRLGRVAFPGRKAIDTPSFIAVTSRGAVPHLTPDNLDQHTSVGAAYMALEDFIERKDPPIYHTPCNDGRRLHSFTAMAADRVTVLGARRCPPVPTPTGNSAKAINMYPSTGFASLPIAEYAAAVESLRPDVAIAPSDALHSSTTPASKKLVKMAERTEEWLDCFLEHFGSRERLDELGISVFAPILPVELPMQWMYLEHLAENVTDKLSGLALYGVAILPELQRYQTLLPLTRLSLDPVNTPHQLLRQISLGIDLCTLAFINTVSDSGVAFSFSFPAPRVSKPVPLGINMHHHRAYLQHLLNAKEMLGWNLLQIHNHDVVSKFFVGIRQSLSQGLEVFEGERKRFTEAYEAEFAEGSGERPRARGYHFKSEAGQAKMNKPGWTNLDACAQQY
ncbi:hypothetical protein CDD81_7385 [Ophiocordyceps australis]|uniref:tRNA-guanine(15) transglycosylase-like domain-containing protein n=1 Tax=Ophiocordyceps australis TaxID=1399860 RepID=A0A2C5Y5N3_9HYPO|nr:hypothetical protein CDD81_7385 [Ophiocordyceps australis]